MEEKMGMDFTAFYNAFNAKDTKKLIVFGWTSESGWRAEIKGIDSDYTLTLIEEGEIHQPAITPFIASIELNEPPKSINVKDDHGDFQVQVYGVPGVGSGANEPGAWVKSG